jgi:hypothetical protein
VPRGHLSLGETENDENDREQHRDNYGESESSGSLESVGEERKGSDKAEAHSQRDVIFRHVATDAQSSGAKINFVR